MRILFDQGTPAPLRSALANHSVATAHEMGWSQLGNGELLAAAEAASFELLVTTDQQLRHQQNLSRRTLAILVLPTTSWPLIRQNIAAILKSIQSASAGSLIEVRW
jgi:glutamate racemase